MNHESYLEELALLKTSPTVLAWAIHLRRLQTGNLDEYVRDRGSFEDYISTILVESSDPPVARTVFGEALKDVIQGWIPSALDTLSEVVMFADLIAAYMPTNGYQKIFLKLQEFTHMQSDVSTRDPMNLAYGRDLRKKMLNTLDSYFAAANPKKDIAYNQFIQLLNSHLVRRGYAGHAARLLFKRGQLALTGKKLPLIIETDLTAIGSILDAILKYSPQVRLEKDIRTLYEYTLQAGEAALDVLSKEVHRSGGTIDLSAEDPFVQFPHTGRILFGLSTNVISSNTFFSKRWEKAKHDWRNKESQIREEAKKESAFGKA